MTRPPANQRAGGAEKPRVVALTPTWNSAEFIERTLESLRAQTYPRLEVLISDDASTDSTPTICERFARGDSRFKVIVRSCPLGIFPKLHVTRPDPFAEHC